MKEGGERRMDDKSRKKDQRRKIHTSVLINNYEVQVNRRPGDKANLQVRSIMSGNSPQVSLYYPQLARQPGRA